jgi:hypothetical protein
VFAAALLDCRGTEPPSAMGSGRQGDGCEFSSRVLIGCGVGVSVRRVCCGTLDCWGTEPPSTMRSGRQGDSG